MFNILYTMQKQLSKGLYGSAQSKAAPGCDASGWDAARSCAVAPRSDPALHSVLCQPSSWHAHWAGSNSTPQPCQRKGQVLMESTAQLQPSVLTAALEWVLQPLQCKVTLFQELIWHWTGEKGRVYFLRFWGAGLIFFCQLSFLNQSYRNTCNSGWREREDGVCG